MEQDQDRNQPATPFKLKEARKRGQVARSLEVNSLLIMATALAMSYFGFTGFATDLLAIARGLLGAAGGIELDAASAFALGTHLTQAAGDLLWPFMLALMVAGILSNLGQTGPVFSFFPLKPDLKRINPVLGFKRLFSKRLLYESIKTIIKVAIFGSVIYAVITGLLSGILRATAIDPDGYPLLLLEYGQNLAYKLLLVMVLIALIDVVYSRLDFGKQMKMSHRELKEEAKRREGDPQIKSRRRQLQREAASRAAALQRVPAADVIITNPTRLAVALQYDRGSMSSPQVVAKGAGELAAKIRQIARAHGVPLVENKPLAQALFFRAAIDEQIPEEHFPAVARILAWVFLARDARAGQPA